MESVERFWEAYRTMPKEERAWYEVLVGGEPCHLYFDIDYKRASPSEITDDEVPGLVARFRELVGKAMWRDFGVKTCCYVDGGHGGR